MGSVFDSGEKRRFLDLLDEDRRRSTGERDGPIIREQFGNLVQIIHSELDHLSAERVINREVDLARNSGLEFEWKYFAHDGPADLARMLGAAGLVAGEEEAVLVLPLMRCPDWAKTPVHEVREVTTFEMVDVLRKVAEEVFDFDYSDACEELKESIRSGELNQLGFVSYEDGVPVGVGRLYPSPHQNFGGLYGGGVLAEYRGRGHYRDLIAARVRRAMELGTRNLLIDALPTSRPIVERLGFVEITRTVPFTLPPTTSIDL